MNFKYKIQVHCYKVFRKNLIKFREISSLRISRNK